MKYLSMAAWALVGATVGSAAWGEMAATLLFTQPGTQIMDGNGVPRPAIRGDVLQPGERLLTPPGAISQIKLPDGSLIGMRPDSELKITPPPLPSDKTPPVVTLISGAARIIGAELMDAKKVSNFTFQSGPAVLKLQGADLESSVIRPPGKDSKPSPGTPPGSYQRLLIGTGSVGNGNLVAPLAPREVSFVGVANVPPITLPSAPPILFTSDSRLLASSVLGTTTTREAPSLNLGTQPLPILGSTPTLPPPTSLPLPVALIPPPVIVAQPIVAFIPPPVVFTAPIVAFTPPPVIYVPPPTVYIPPPTLVLVKPCSQFIGTTCVR